MNRVVLCARCLVKMIQHMIVGVPVKNLEKSCFHFHCLKTNLETSCLLSTEVAPQGVRVNSVK